MMRARLSFIVHVSICLSRTVRGSERDRESKMTSGHYGGWWRDGVAM